MNGCSVCRGQTWIKPLHAFASKACNGFLYVDSNIHAMKGGFAFFYHLARNNKMVGTSTMVSYINRDELEHGRFISELFRATLAENPEHNNGEFIDWVYGAFRQSIELEIEWSNYVLKEVEGIDLVEMEGYIKYRGNKMLRMMGLNELYPEHTENPMKWIHAYVDNFDGTKTDFFEQKSRQYTKTSELNGFDDL